MRWPGRPTEILGRTDVELFGAEVAARQSRSDHRALEGRAVVAEPSQITLGGRTRYLIDLENPGLRRGG